MNGPYRTAACVEAAAEEHACSPALCCACPSCRSTSELLARWLASQKEPRPRAGLPTRVSRTAAAVTLGIVSSALVVAVGIAAGSAARVHAMHDLLEQEAAARRQIADLQAERRAAEHRIAEARSAQRATEHTAAQLAAGDRPLPWPPFLLGYAGSESHDPDVLLTRALRFVGDGLDLRIERTTLTPAELTEIIGDGSWPVIPRKLDGAVVGFVLDPEDTPPHAARLRRLGLESGDILTAVNGHPLTSPDRALEAYSHVRDRRKALFEIIRGQRRVVLLVQIR